MRRIEGPLNRGGVCVAVVAMLIATGVAPLCAQAPDLIGQRIVAIQLECAAPIDTQGLSRLLPMHIGDPLRREDLEEARRRLDQEEVFTRIDIELQARPGGVGVIVHLVRKSVINRIRFEGNHEISDSELFRIVRLREGMTLSDELRESAVQHLHERYVAEGFEDAQIAPYTSTRSPGETDITFRIHEGDPLRISAVDIQGSVPISQDDLRDAIKIKSGDRYVREQLRTADKAVLRLLRRKQFYEAEVESQWQRGEGKSGHLRFTIDAGSPVAVSFAGNHRFTNTHLLDLMDLPNRPIVTDGTWRELARRARRAYQEDGYYFARVDVRIEAGPPKRVQFDVDEGREFHIARVEFEGNTGLSESTLRASMGTRPPSWIPWGRGVLLDDVLDDDLKRLWYLYRRHGYESAEIADTRTHFDPERGSVVVTVVVNEGLQSIVRVIERTGIEPVAEHLPEFAVKIGQPVDPDQVEADRRALVGALAQAGYTHAVVEATTHTEPQGEAEAATVRFAAVPGDRERVGTIIVQNNIDTHSSIIFRELPFRSGDVLDPNALLRGQSNIYKLGLFRSATVRPVEGDMEPGSGERSRDVVVSVAEKPPGSLQYGVGYNTRDGFRGFTEVSYNNLQGLARLVSLRGELNVQPGDLLPNEYLANLGFREPRLGDTLWTFRANLIAQRSTRRVDQFSLDRFALIPAIERTIIPGLQAGVDMQLEQAQVFGLFEDVVAFNPRDVGRLRTISVGPFAVYDGRDDAFVPRRGIFDSLRLRIAPRQLGSDVPFFKLLAEHAQYVPLSDDLTFVYVGRAGWAVPFQSGDVIPIRERFFLGGRTTVRGFGENTIGPKGSSTDAEGNAVQVTDPTAVAADDPLGGDLVVNLNAELRFPLAFGFGGVVFADGGGVYLQHCGDHPEQCGVSIHDFRRSAGLGLRYLTPVGPISLEYGFKLDRRPAESVGEVHFSVGTVF
jgi:outer membrane protein insertion porin family